MEKLYTLLSLEKHFKNTWTCPSLIFSYMLILAPKMLKVTAVLWNETLVFDSCPSFSPINCYSKLGPFYICITLCIAARILALQTPWNKCSHSIPCTSLFSCDWLAHCSDSRGEDGGKSELCCVASECLSQLILTSLDRVSRICCISKCKAVLL